MEWNGIYVPELDTPMDLNEDGVLDVAFYRVYAIIRRFQELHISMLLRQAAENQMLRGLKMIQAGN